MANWKPPDFVFTLAPGVNSADVVTNFQNDDGSLNAAFADVPGLVVNNTGTNGGGLWTAGTNTLPSGASGQIYLSIGTVGGQVSNLGAVQWVASQSVGPADQNAASESAVQLTVVENSR
jgi:hypothetical protein